MNEWLNETPLCAKCGAYWKCDCFATVEYAAEVITGRSPTTVTWDDGVATLAELRRKGLLLPPSDDRDITALFTKWEDAQLPTG